MTGLDPTYGFSPSREHKLTENFCDVCKSCRFKDCPAHDVCTCPKEVAA